MQNIDKCPKLQQHIQRMGFSGTVGTKDEWLSFIDELNELLGTTVRNVTKKELIDTLHDLSKGYISVNQALKVFLCEREETPPIKEDLIIRKCEHGKNDGSCNFKAITCPYQYDETVFCHEIIIKAENL